MLEVRRDRVLLPKIVIGMLDEIVPGWELLVEVARLGVRERSQRQVPTNGVVPVKLEVGVLSLDTQGNSLGGLLHSVLRDN